MSEDDFLLGANGVVDKTLLYRDAVKLFGCMLEQRNDLPALVKMVEELESTYLDTAAILFRCTVLVASQAMVRPLAERLIAEGVDYADIVGMVVDACAELSAREAAAEPTERG